MNGVNLDLFVWCVFGVATVVFSITADRYLSQRQRTVRAMTEYGEHFLREFKRPLIDPVLNVASIRSRLRVSPDGDRLEICLAPAGGRRYPNLSDHKENVGTTSVASSDHFTIPRLSAARCTRREHGWWSHSNFTVVRTRKVPREHPPLEHRRWWGQHSSVREDAVRRDLAATDATDPVNASRLRAAISTCFLDTNEFSMSDLPAEERLLIGARTTGRMGARHNPEVAKQALEESKSDVEAVIRRHSVIIVIGTAGKGTGAGTILPLAQIARQHRKLVIPVFVRPSFERHEVDKRRYDYALAIGQQFDAAHIRLIEILNDRGYNDAEPQPQSTVWERMNLRSRVRCADCYTCSGTCRRSIRRIFSTLFAGPGRLRMGFGRADPPTVLSRLTMRFNRRRENAGGTRTMHSVNPSARR